MKRHHSIIAVVVVIIMAIIAALGFRGLPGTSTPQAGEALIPDLAARADSITEIDLLAGQTTSVLQRQGDRFVLSGQGNLPVPTDRVRQLLNQLAQIELLEPKTDNPARYAQLGVGAIMNDSQAREIRLLTGPNQLLADVIVGREAPNLSRLGGGLYVRRASEAQSWLAEGQLQLPAGSALWAGGPLFPVQDERQLKSVTLSDNGERVIEAGREAPALPITHVEPDLPQPDQARLGRLLALAATLAASDIKALPANARPTRLASFQAFDGTIYRLALYPEGKELWARASMEGGPESTVAKQFTADHATALYRLPPEAAALLQAQPADFAQMGEPEKKPAVPVAPPVQPVAHPVARPMKR
jgi:hypothetical protein